MRRIAAFRFVAVVIASTHLAQAASAANDGRNARTNFALHCSGCHGLEGRGASARGGVPDFVDSVGYFAADDLGRTYLVNVPGITNTELSEADIAAVLNYTLRTWGGASNRRSTAAFTESEVARRRSMRVADVVELRRNVVKRLSKLGYITAPYPWP